MKIIIIEDEIAIAANLKDSILILRPSYQILKILSSVQESIAFFKTNPLVDLIFSDVTLLDGHCFEIFETVEIKCPIIFCTAYEQYALDAFGTNGIDYILKPYSKERLEKAIQKTETFIVNRHTKAASSPKEHLLIYYKNQVIPIEYQSIAIIYIKNDITYLKDNKNRQFALNSTLDELEHRLNDHFFRANRQMIIHRNYIDKIEKDELRKLLVKLKVDFEEDIIVGKVKAASFLKWIES